MSVPSLSDYLMLLGTEIWLLYNQDVLYIRYMRVFVQKFSANLSLKLL